MKLCFIDHPSPQHMLLSTSRITVSHRRDYLCFSLQVSQRSFAGPAMSTVHWDGPADKERQPDMKEMCLAVVTVLLALISFLSKTIEKRWVSSPLTALRFWMGRLRKKPHTCQNACCSVFPLLSAKSRSELIMTERSLWGLRIRMRRKLVGWGWSPLHGEEWCVGKARDTAFPTLALQSDPDISATGADSLRPRQRQGLTCFFSTVSLFSFFPFLSLLFLWWMWLFCSSQFLVCRISWCESLETWWKIFSMKFRHKKKNIQKV